MTNNDIIVKMIKKYCESFIGVINTYIERDIASDYDLGKRFVMLDLLEYIESLEERGDDND